MASKQLQMKDQFEYKLDEVHYPYHEANSDRIAREHQKMSIVVPTFGIASEKQPFYLTNHHDLRFVLQRKELHAHKYQFSFHDKELDTVITHTILWDYETGHVRISPMFKSAEYEYLRRKNTPRRWVERNGLQDCYASTTGGKIEAQGFWLPFIAAKALCTRFCYNIRYALTPLFGNDFPALCKYERQNLLDMGYKYGTENSLDIDKEIVEAVRARQAVVEWQILLRDGEQRSDRKIPLSSLEDTWKAFVSATIASKIPPEVRYPCGQLPNIASIKSLPSCQTWAKRKSARGTQCKKYPDFELGVKRRIETSCTMLPSLGALLFLDDDIESDCDYLVADTYISSENEAGTWEAHQESDLQAAYALMQLKYGSPGKRSMMYCSRS